MKKILITGSSGFIAKELIELLIQKDDLELYLLYRTKNSDVKKIKNCINLYCDICDKQSLNLTLGKIDFDYVIHLAAQSNNSTSYKSSGETLETNIQGTLNLLQECSNKAIKGFIFASSAIVYAFNEETPLKESYELEGKNIYAISKICSESIAKYFSKSYQIPLIVCRLGMVYGGGDTNMTRLVPYIMNCLISNKEIDIRSSKNVVLDPIYVTDVGKSFIKLLEYFDKHEKVQEVFNLSSGKPIKMEDFVGKILATSGIKGIIPKYGDSSATTQLLSKDKFEKKIGKLKGCEMEEALKETLSWYQRNGIVKSKDL
jgi:nucleoside-diphosphate-sugar epimerase